MSTITDEQLRTNVDQACWRYAMQHGGSAYGGRTDPYERAHRAADYWLADHGPPRNSADVRTYGMVYFGGWRAGTGAMVRGWQERLRKPWVPWTWDYTPGDTHLVCPYAYSQHGGASRGGGTFAAQYRKAWDQGVWFANKRLAVLLPKLHEDMMIYGAAWVHDGERIAPPDLKVLGEVRRKDKERLGGGTLWPLWRVLVLVRGVPVQLQAVRIYELPARQ